MVDDFNKLKIFNSKEDDEDEYKFLSMVDNFGKLYISNSKNDDDNTSNFLSIVDDFSQLNISDDLKSVDAIIQSINGEFDELSF